MEFSLGLIEVQALGHAIFVLDAMTKAADVEFVATERRLGGRLVTLVVKGEVSAVTAAVEAGKELARELGCLKAAEVIARPHNEILKFLHLDEKQEVKAKAENAATHVDEVEKKDKAASKESAEKIVSKAQKASDKKPSQKRAAKKGVEPKNK